MEGYAHSYLLTLIRHKIIHNQENADKKFIKKTKKLNCKEAKHFSDIKVNSTISAPIDKIILPCLEKSSKFVKNSSVLFISHFEEA